ncbi:protoplast regeneration and killer toxin resistance protein [Diplodia corticola]|uniref:Protoplast regeneration and killer toxin resistance protein n=1 Tax=Diplodia corticola TaxID=236234 RepID=A0A1J9QXV6_9PEZI|nr:protoplast regeneration and killer toxin resistance protein [Diplodia corticola]OJD32826.1 protoplast regeneration and killer toxin resistance protein [Diplodia corticola]
MGYQDAVHVQRAAQPPSQGAGSQGSDAANAYPSPSSSVSPSRRPVNGHRNQPSITLQGPSNNAVQGNRTSVQSLGGFSNGSRDVETPEPDRYRDSVASNAIHGDVPYRQARISVMSNSPPASMAGDVLTEDFKRHTIASDMRYEDLEEEPEFEQPQYFHQPYQVQPVKPRKAERRDRVKSTYSDSQGSSSGQSSGPRVGLSQPRSTVTRPVSAFTLNPRDRHPSPGSGDLLAPSPTSSPAPYARSLSGSRRSPDNRPHSYVDLLNNVPYAQQIAPAQDLSQSALRGLVGNDVSLLDTQKTVEMYMANVKKTPDSSVQYEFAVYLVQAAKEYIHSEDPAKKAYAETVMVKESRQILQRLADRSYPFAQYLLADGYSSGFFNKGKPDQEKAFPLFVAASKHGHAESGFRAALMYEHGWGSRKDLAKASQFYRASASKGHPGAASRLGQACIFGELGLGRRDREGLKWLKRASESADPQYNVGPLLLAKLHEHGHGDDCFKDEAYAAQLYTQAAELGNAEACFKMGECYEHGFLNCPKDPALSVHFYTGAAMQDIPDAMMCLCAWYLVGAPPVLEKDENESYEWAKRAAETGLPKAEYAVGYFTEMGIGCRRDPLEANVWYVRAADKGEPRAKQRLAIIRAAASGETGAIQPEGRKKGKDDKDCVVM